MKSESATSLVKSESATNDVKSEDSEDAKPVKKAKKERFTKAQLDEFTLTDLYKAIDNVSVLAYHLYALCLTLCCFTEPIIIQR